MHNNKQEYWLPITAKAVKELAHACGFELAGITEALPAGDWARYESWRSEGMAGDMRYLTDYRGDLRSDPRQLLPSAQIILCVGKLYNTGESVSQSDPDAARISRYARGEDYHGVLRAPLHELLRRIEAENGSPVEAKICLDTAPLLERSYARLAGLGWIGKNTCLINERKGSWFFLAEILLSIPLECDAPPPDRCGVCTRCIDACPTEALVPDPQGGWRLDARRCISYLTIEKRGISEGGDGLDDQLGNHVFGCDICQEVCPWNTRAPVVEDGYFGASPQVPALAELAQLSEPEFRDLFRKTPVWRAKYEGFLRNVAVALGNSGRPENKVPLEALARHDNPVVAGTARRALKTLAVLLVLCVGIAHSAMAPVDAGFDHFYNNEFDAALISFEQHLKANPNDPANYNHVAQAILYREMLRSGALESQMVSGNNPFLRRGKMEIAPTERDRFNQCVTQSIALSEKALQKDPNDKSALAALTVIHGLRANYLFLVEKSYMDSLHEATAARKADERLIELDPKNVDAHLVFGLNQYVVGSLPFYMRAVGFLGGFHGDKENGIKELEMVAEHGVRNHYDAQVLLAAIYRREKTPGKAIPMLKNLAARFPRNYLFRLEQVQMYSDLGDKKSALAMISEIENLRNSGAPGYAGLPREKVLYFRGNLLFWYRDLDASHQDLQQVTKSASDLDLNTAVMAWLRLGQVSDLLGHRKEAVAAYREALQTAPKSDAGSEAKSYIGSAYRRR